MYLIGELDMPPACAVGRFRREISHALATQRTLCVRTDVHFPSNIGAKGSRREESRIFPKHRNAAEVDAELSETARSRTDCPWLSLRACSNRREFLNPQTPRHPLMPPPLSAPNRSSKNIAEPARLRSFRASPFRKSVRGVWQNRIVMGAGDCGGRLRVRDSAKPVMSCFSLRFSKLRIGRAKCDNIGSIEKVSYT